MAVDKFAGVHPDLVAAIRRVLTAMEILGFPMLVTDGLRTTAQQQALFSQGRTKPGAIVTNADGVTHKSNHQAKSDGWGHACDLTFLDGNGKPSWAEHWPWDTYGACCKAVGLNWGGSWTRLRDRPHAELP